MWLDPKGSFRATCYAPSVVLDHVVRARRELRPTRPRDPGFLPWVFSSKPALCMFIGYFLVFYAALVMEQDVNKRARTSEAPRSDGADDEMQGINAAAGAIAGLVYVLEPPAP